MIKISGYGDLSFFLFFSFFFFFRFLITQHFDAILARLSLVRHMPSENIRNMLRRESDQRIHHKKKKKKKKKKSKPRLFFNSFINQTSLVNIYEENTANMQSRAGREFFGGVQPVGRKKSFQKHISQHLHPSSS